MMSKETKSALIISLYGNTNYGNKLQNYAVYRILSDFGLEVLNLKNNRNLNFKRNICLLYTKYLLSRLKYFFVYMKKFGLVNYLIRNIKFRKFSKNIPTSKRIFNYSKVKKYESFDYLVVGSDQVWNPATSLDDLMVLRYFNNPNKIAFSASIGTYELSSNAKKIFRKSLNDFKAISVRENEAKAMLKDCKISHEITTLIDPTMILSKDEWNKLSKRPKQFEKKNADYILIYYLGTLSDSTKKDIYDFAINNGLKVINIYDKKDKYITSDPSEFLFLEKNAKLIFTDSFHSAVFGIIFNTPIMVGSRNGAKTNMNSRIDTLLSKFGLEDRRYTGTISKECFKCNYNYANEILKKERKLAMNFLKKALDIKDSDKNE